MMQFGIKRHKILIILGVVVALAVAAILFFVVCRNCIEGQWEMTDIRPTAERLARYGAAQQEMLRLQYAYRLESEDMQMQFFDDGTGIMTLTTTEGSNTNTFFWSSENRMLTINLGIIAQPMEYSVSSSRLILINHEEGGGTTREFRRVRR